MRPTGDVVFAKFFRTPVVVLNSKEAAVDLMEKRSAKYSDRPPFILLKELCVICPASIAAAASTDPHASSLPSMGWDSVINNLPYGERFRKHRKWLQDAFTSKAALMSYRPIQRRETYTLLAGLCDSPEFFMDHITRCAAIYVVLRSVGSGGTHTRLCADGQARWCWTSRMGIGLRPCATPWWRPLSARPWRPCLRGARAPCWWTSSLSVRPFLLGPENGCHSTEKCARS